MQRAEHNVFKTARNLQGGCTSMSCISIVDKRQHGLESKMGFMGTGQQQRGGIFRPLCLLSHMDGPLSYIYSTNCINIDHHSSQNRCPKFLRHLESSNKCILSEFFWPREGVGYCSASDLRLLTIIKCSDCYVVMRFLIMRGWTVLCIMMAIFSD